MEEKWIKALGLGCIVAGIARMGMTPASMIWGFNSAGELLFGFTACVLMGLVTIAFYAVQARETGIPGLVTALAMAIGNILTAPILWGYLQYGTFGDENAPVYTVTQLAGSIGVLGGAVILPILSWRAKVFPRWAIVSMTLMLFSMALPWSQWFAFFWGLAYAVPGYCIWAGKLNRTRELPASRLGRGTARL